MKEFLKDDDEFHNKAELNNSLLQEFKSEFIFQKLPIGIVIIDPATGKFLFINSKFAQILGYTEEELLKKTFQSITYPADLNKNLDLHEKLRKGETDSYTLEKRNVRKDGSIVWVDLTVIRLSDKKNRRDYHLGAIYDLSERKLAEQQLKDSEELLRTVITNAPISIFATDEEGIFTLHEGKAIERVGMRAGENVGASAYELFAGLEVVEHNGQVTTGKTVLERIANGEYLSGITELNDVIFDNQFAPIWDINGKVKGLLGIATDITEQKRMEKERLEFETRYRMLFNEIDEGFCIIEMVFDECENPIDYCFLEINPAFEKQTGLIAAQGKRMRELVPFHEESWFEIYGRIALTGIPERFVNRAEQLHRWYDVYAFRLGQPEKRQVAILFNDISERKRIQDELQDREEKWHNLFEILPVGVSIVNAQNDPLEINDSLSEILGISKDQLIKGAHGKNSYFRSDMTPMPPEEFPSLRALSEKKIVRDVEIGIKKEDGTMIWTNVSAAPISSLKYSVTITTDITKQKKTMEKIRESEHNLEEAQRLAKIGSWEWNTRTDEISWSKEYYRIYGFDPKTPPPRYDEHLEVYSPESQNRLDEAVKKSMETGHSYKIDLKLTDKKVGERWIRARGECRFDEYHNIIGLHGTAQDITDLKMREEELRYRAEIAANISDGVMLIREKDEIIVHTSLRFEDMFGYGKGELIGKHVSVLNAPDSNRNAIKTDKIIINYVRDHGKWKGVVQNARKDGSIFWSQASVTQFEHSSFGKVLITIQMDITEQVLAEMALRENEIRQRAMIANISDVITIVDRNEIIRYKSSNVEKWFGWTSDELIGQNALDNIHSNDQKRIKDDFNSLLAEPGKVINTECCYLCKDHRFKWIELTAVNQIDNPAIGGILVNYHDISQRKKAQEKLIRHEKELRLLSSELITAQEKEKKMLARELHDEIGQALTAMKINLSTVLKNIPVETHNLACERIKETDELLDTILTRVHDISLNLHPSILEILGFAATIKSYAQQFEKRTGITVRVIDNFNSNLNNEQEINLFRIVQEALTNVAKHADAQNIEICITSRKEWFYLTINDDGKGFDTNFKSGKSGKHMGIGLIGMNERVSALQGKFQISSGIAKGTNLRIKVPLHGQ